MSDIRIMTEIGKKIIADVPFRSQERELANEVSSRENLSELTLTVLERRELAKKTLSEIRSWISEINPNYDPYSPYGNNCGTCAWAVHNRLKGYKDIVAGRINIAPKDADMEELTGQKCVYMHPSDIEQILKSRGPGAEVIVGINRTEGSGHWFNAFYDGEKIYTVDGQSGEILDWPYDYGDISAWCALV